LRKTCFGLPPKTCRFGPIAETGYPRSQLLGGRRCRSQISGFWLGRLWSGVRLAKVPSGGRDLHEEGPTGRLGWGGWVCDNGTMTLALPDIPDLAACLERLWRQIPVGRVATYGDLADALGDRIAARWVGHCAMHHAHDDDCPCHRLVRADGGLGNYISGRIEDKRRRLRREGVASRDGLVKLADHRFTRFETDRPLVALRRAQEAIVEHVSLRPPRKLPELVAGVDVSYTASGEGVAAYVLAEAASGNVVWKTIVRRPVRFPYITSFLSFRELPLLVDLLDEVDRQVHRADVVLVDGSGLLHHRHAGIATHLGVLRGQSTVGVTKKLLFGTVDIGGMRPGESRPVLIDGEPLGVALRATAGSRRPIFLSPGHRIDRAGAEATVRAVLRGRRLPEPLYWADRLSREAARESVHFSQMEHKPDDSGKGETGER